MTLELYKDAVLTCDVPEHHLKRGDLPPDDRSEVPSDYDITNCVAKMPQIPPAANLNVLFEKQHVEEGGLDVHEHGMWGYPEFYIPVPGGYGTESHSHLGTSGGHAKHAPLAVHSPTPLPEA